MRPLPTIRQLQYLSALSETLSFNKAADLCLVTQSTLSAGIKDLEILLDAHLVERTKRKVMLTPLGTEILIRGQKILEIANEISDMAQQAGEPLSGPLRLGVIPDDRALLAAAYSTSPQRTLSQSGITGARRLKRRTGGPIR